MTTGNLSGNSVLLLSLAAFAIVTVTLKQSAPIQETTPLLKIESVEINRLTWENLEVISDFSLGYVAASMSTVATVSEEIFVFNSCDDLIYKGNKNGNITIPDADLGSNEKLLVKYCITRSGKTVCKDKTIFASPKELTIEPAINYPYNNRIFLGEFKLKSVLKRAVYGQSDKVETIGAKNLTGTLKLLTKDNSVAVTVPISGEEGVFDISNSENYQSFKRKIQQAIYNDNLDIDFEIEVESFGAKAYFPKSIIPVAKKECQSNGLSDASSPLLAANTSILGSAVDCGKDERTASPNSVAKAIHSNPIEEKESTDCGQTTITKEPTKPWDVVNHVPMKPECDLYEAIPTPIMEARAIQANKPTEPAPMPAVFAVVEKPVNADRGTLPTTQASERKVNVLPKKEVKSVKEATPNLSTNYAQLADTYADAIQKYVIRMVHPDPVLSKESKVTSWKHNQSSGQLIIDLSVDWVDRWMEENYQLVGQLTIDEDGKNAKFTVVSKNQTVIDLEDFNGKETIKSIYIRPL